MFIKPKRKVKSVYIHCSDSDVKQHDDISIIRRWHVKERGWKDIGYHYFITKKGVIQNGRPLEKIPSAQKGFNRYTISICVSGKNKFTKKSFDSLRKLCREINGNYERITFHGHCEIDPNKTCPNFDCQKVLNINNLGVLNEQISFSWNSIINFLLNLFNKTKFKA